MFWTLKVEERVWEKRGNLLGQQDLVKEVTALPLRDLRPRPSEAGKESDIYSHVG